MTLPRIAAVLLCVGAVLHGRCAVAQSGTVTLIHLGDLHGHLMPRPDALRGGHVGGVARIHTVVERIRARAAGRSLLLVVGDAVQGSAEALFTRGQAVVDALAPFAIDAFAPGNWDYVYGPERFRELFAGRSGHAPLARWHALAANLYEGGDSSGSAPRRVLPATLVRDIGGVRVGIIGLTTRRGPRALGADALHAFRFTFGDEELPALIKQLRDSAGAHVIVLLSELELANNLRLADRFPGIDVILSADMHERTTRPIVGRYGTVVVEEGQDGSVVGELALTVRDGRMREWTWQAHDVTDDVPESPVIAQRVAELRRPFVRGPAFDAAQINPIDGALLHRPIDEVVGYTRVALHRANPTGATVPAVLEGTSHDMVADAMRAATGADVALMRGFRFGTHVLPGPITREDLYHLLPTGAQVATLRGVRGAALRTQIENALRGTFDPDPRQWTGGWVFAFSGLSMEVDVEAPFGHRASSVWIGATLVDTTSARSYAVAGPWYASEPGTINNCPCGAGTSVDVLRDGGGRVLDAVEVVARYLASLPDSSVAPVTGRVRTLRPLPTSPFGFDLLQPIAPPRPATRP